VPEATVHEDRDARSSEHEIPATAKAREREAYAEAEAEAVSGGTEAQHRAASRHARATIGRAVGAMATPPQSASFAHRHVL
jgi:hypothetical protein